MVHLFLVSIGGASLDEAVQQDAGEAEEADRQPHEGDGHLGALLRPGISVCIYILFFPYKNSIKEGHVQRT